MLPPPGPRPAGEARSLRDAGQLLRDARRLLSRDRAVRASLARWSALGLVGAVGGAILGDTLGAFGRPGAAIAVSLLAGVGWWLVVTAVLAAGSPLLLEYPSGRPFPGLGVPNGITAQRAYLCLPVILFALLPDRELGRILFLAVGSPIAFLDVVDGFIARRVGPVTVLGRALDPIMDTLFFPLAGVGCWLLGFVPFWFLLAILGRYGLPGLGFLVLYPWGGRHPPVVATALGKANTLITSFGLLTCAVLTLLGTEAAAAAVVIGIPMAATGLGHLIILGRRVGATGRA